METAHGEFYGGAVWWSGEPEVEVLSALLGFEEENYIARVEFRKRVEEKVVAGCFLFGVEFAFFVCVREEGGEVREEVAVSGRFYCVSFI